jgi:hypothetical protein
MKTYKKNKKSGSILLVVMIIGLGLVATIGSFIGLSVHSLKSANRSLYANGALNLAEAGLEEAIYSLNNVDWTGWTKSGSNATKSWSTETLGSGVSTEIKVKVYNYGSKSPSAIAEATAIVPNSPNVTKQIKIELGKTSYWANGIVAKDQVIFKGGNAKVDSYKSSDPTYSTGGKYDSSKRNDKGSVGSVSVNTDAISVSNADIYGYAATGGVRPTVGTNGKIHGKTTPVGTDVDPDRIATDFTSNFEDVDVPTGGSALGAISGTTTIAGTTTSGATTTYQASSIKNNNGEVTTITGNVVLVVTADVTIKGEIQLATGATLQIYVAGDMDVGGTGIANMDGLPENFQIFGSSTTSQTIKLHGNGAVQAVIYAPYASVELKGGGASGEMMGSVVANDVFINGTYEFHYDEALEDVDASKVFSLSSWRELTDATEKVTL